MAVLVLVLGVLTESGRSRLQCGSSVCRFSLTKAAWNQTASKAFCVFGMFLNQQLSHATVGS